MTGLACSAFGRHSRLAWCVGHQAATTLVRLADGCQARVCPACCWQAGVARWPDLAGGRAGVLAAASIGRKHAG